MTNELQFFVRKHKDPTGTRTVIVFKNYKQILKEIIKLRIKDQEKNQDSIYLVCGKEGRGKSMFCLHNIEIFDELTNKETPIDHITRNLEELSLLLGRAPARSAIVLDEGSELSSDRYAEKTVKNIREKITIMRKKGHIVYICFTNPLKINTYFREDRFRGLFMCKKLGTIYYYSQERVLEILQRFNKDMGGVRSGELFLKYAPNYIIYPEDYNGKLRKEYEKRKDTNIEIKLDNPLDIIPKDTFTFASVTKALHISHQTMHKLHEQGIFEILKIGNRIYINHQNLIKLKRHLGINTIETNNNTNDNNNNI